MDCCEAAQRLDARADVCQQRAVLAVGLLGDDGREARHAARVARVHLRTAGGIEARAYAIYYTIVYYSMILLIILLLILLYYTNILYYYTRLLYPHGGRHRDARVPKVAKDIDYAPAVETVQVLACRPKGGHARILGGGMSVYVPL